RAHPQHQQIVRRRRAAILGLQNSQARDSRSLGIRYGNHQKATAEHAEHAEPDFLSGLCALGGCSSSVHVRRCLAAAEYSSICAVKSRGYEISTSTIRPAPSRTAASRGMTKAV